jgi:hypothetical protein
LGIYVLKKTFLAGAAAAAFLLPAIANAQDGYIGLSYHDSDDADTDALAVSGAATAEVGPAKLQFNATHARFESAGANASASDFVAHAYTQNDTYAVGGFVSGTDVGGSGIYGIGAEGSWYINNFTLSAVVSHNAIDNGGGHFNNYGASARWFATENLAFGASYDTLDFDNSSVDVDVWGLDVEFQTSTPASVFASYGNVDAGVGAETDKWSIGVRYNFGGKTLKDQERSGAKAMRATSAMGRAAF